MQVPTALVEIVDCEFTTSKTSSMPMFKVTLIDAETGQFVCCDYIMLDGAGQKYGDKKLAAFGVEPGAGPADAHTLIGKRAVAALMWETYQGKRKKRVDGNADGFEAGYLPESDWVKPPSAPPRKPSVPGERQLFQDRAKAGYDPADDSAKPF